MKNQILKRCLSVLAALIVTVGGVTVYASVLPDYENKFFTGKLQNTSTVYMIAESRDLQLHNLYYPTGAMSNIFVTGHNPETFIFGVGTNGLVATFASGSCNQTMLDGTVVRVFNQPVIISDTEVTVTGIFSKKYTVSFNNRDYESV